MAITISGENNNDKILASDGVIDQISGINIVGLLTAGHINVGSNIQLGNAGIITATTFVGNVTGNVNSTSPLLLQTGGSERFRITGNNELGIAGANYGTSGQVLTSGGSGSAVSWTTIPTQVTISNNATDRVITGGSGTNLNGEANLTFTGQTLTAHMSTADPAVFVGDSNRTGAGQHLAEFRGYWDGNHVARIVYAAGDDTSNKDDGIIKFHTSLSGGGGITERLRIASDGNVGIKSTAPRGKLDIQFDGAPNFITFGSDADNPKMEWFRSTGGSPSHYANEIQMILGDLVLSTAPIANLGSHSYSEKLRISSAGYIGIQTAVPKSFFHASRPSTCPVTLNFGDPVAQILQCEDSEFALGLHNAHPYPLFIQGRTRYNVARQIALNPLGGNIGINQIAPQRILHVGESGTAEANIRIQGGSDYAEIRVKDSDNNLSFHHNVGGAGSRELFNSNGSTGHFSINCYSYQALTITTNENGTNGPEIQLMHNTASPAANDTIGQLRFSGKDSAGNTQIYSKIETKVDDPTSGSETGHINFATLGLGSFSNVFRIKRRSTASAPSYTADDADGVILDIYNTGNPYPRYMNFIAKSAGNTDSNIGFWTEAVGGSPTEKLRITSSGQLLQGETSAFDSNTAIQFRKDVSGNQARFIFRNRANNGNSRVQLQLSTLNRAANADTFSGIEKYQSGGMAIYNGENTNQYSNINFFTNGWRSLQLRNGNHSGAWCAEIDAYWGTSNGLRMEVGGPQSGTWQAIDFHTSHTGTQRGYIGVTYGGVSYNSSSDYRMKQDVVDLTGAIDRVKSFKPRRFRWKEDLTHTVDGFLAHEAQTVVPESVQGEKDGEQMQVMDNSKLVPVLTAALKEAIAKIETLETKVAALEG